MQGQDSGSGPLPIDVDAEGVWARAWRDTLALYHSPLFAVAELLIAPSTGWLLSHYPPRLLAEWDSGLLVIVGGAFAVGVVAALAFAWNLLRAPYRQRDEARAQRGALVARLSADPARETASKIQAFSGARLGSLKTRLHT